MKLSGKTDTGLVRTHNEDALYAAGIARWGLDEAPEGLRYYLAIVADGMGGAAAGELASSLAVQHIVRILSGTLLGFKERVPVVPVNIPGLMTKAVHEANDVILNRALEEPAFDGMGTTVVVVLTFNGSAYWASVGDSRLYLFRRGRLRQVSEDHSYVGELVRQGKITDEQARRHPNRNLITRSVGAEDVPEVDTGVFQLAAGDHIMLCSDGLSGMVRDATLETTLRDKGDSERSCEEITSQMIDMACAAGGSDNISIVLLEVESEDTAQVVSTVSMEKTMRMDVPPNIIAAR